MRKKTLSAFLGLVLGASTILGSVGANPVPVSAGTDGITDSECTTTGTAEPAGGRQRKAATASVLVPG